MEKFEKNFDRQEQKPAYQERREEMTENEKKVLENLRGMVDWFNSYKAKKFKVGSDTVSRTNANLKNYISEFRKEFDHFESEADEREILLDAEKADMVFLGDYHNLLKTQKFTADFIEKLASSSNRPNVLAVEFADPKKQRFLNAYLAGRIGEKTFLKKINFADWGDPEHWAGYKRLLELAKKYSMPAYGIKVQPSGMQEKRDEAFAQIIFQIVQANPDAKLLVNIGDAHLASGHLPAKISGISDLRSKKLLTVLQNIEPLYFAALEKYQDFRIPKVLKVKNGLYNISTAPILTRLISDVENLNYLWSERQDTFPSELWPEVVSRLRKILGRSQPAESGEIPKIFFGSRANSVWRRLVKSLPEKETQGYQKILDEKGCVYLPLTEKRRSNAAGVIIVRRFRLKKVLEELAKFTFWPEQKGEDFLYFCSKFFIPERQPENEAERAGEKIFQNWLAG